jgi:phosphoribosylaminoimidazolecarboxamide formyltransferase/IMP cyclohydrolase
MSEEKKASDMYREQTLRSWPVIIKTVIDGGGAIYGKEEDLKYSTNPFHAAAVFNQPGNTPLFVLSKTGKGGPSQTNYEDVDRALRIMRSVESMGQQPTVAVMKHVNPSGVAVNGDQLEAFVNAWDCDARAAYGGTVAFNFKITANFLKEAYGHIRKIDSKTFIDVLVAPEITEDAREYLNKKEAIRVFEYDALRLSQIDPFKKAKPELKFLFDGRVIAYEPYVEAVRSKDDLKIMTKRQPSNNEVRDMLFAWYVCANTRSNAIVLAKNTATVAIGTGKQERISAIEDAIAKAEAKAAYRKTDPKDCMRGAVMASDGFIPNIDNIPPLKERGVTAIVHPGGSKAADDAVIAACNEADIAIAFTEWRCFSHH